MRDVREPGDAVSRRLSPQAGVAVCHVAGVHRVVLASVYRMDAGAEIRGRHGVDRHEPVDFPEKYAGVRAFYDCVEMIVGEAGEPVGSQLVAEGHGGGLEELVALVLALGRDESPVLRDAEGEY